MKFNYKDKKALADFKEEPDGISLEKVYDKINNNLKGIKGTLQSHKYYINEESSLEIIKIYNGLMIKKLNIL